MKNLFIILFITVAYTLIHAQQFSRLSGLEDEQGNTILLYSFGNDMTGLYAPVYKYFVNTTTETKIIDAYAQQIDTFNVNAKSVIDYEFFPNDINNFINVGLTLNIDVLGYAARNDTTTFTDWAFFFVDISNQHPNEVYISDFFKVYRSFDAGYTYPVDSTIDFQFLSVADFDDRVFFGTDNNRLIKSEDQGISSSIVDTSDFETSMPGLAFYYDVNQFHIYRLNRSNGKFTLNVSNNKGNAFSWTKTYESDTQFFITTESTQSGVVFLADGRRIYKSTNNGYTFFEYKSLPSKLVGIYKKPNSEILYAASKNMIFKVTPDSITIIKSLPFPEEEYGWFPLAVGNKWAFNSYWSEENTGYPPTITFAGTKFMEVVKDTMIQSKNYFVVENNLLTQMIFERRMFLRIDSTSGLVYRYWEDLNGEFLFHSLNAEVGDTIPYPLFPEEPYYILMSEEPISFLDNETFIRNYIENLPCGCGHSLIRGYGLASAHFNEFGGSDDYLKGCVINGVLYGDTTYVVDVEEEQNPIPTEYRLEQNYPNPFNPSTKISWQLPISSWVTLKIFDALGREVETLVNEYQNSGNHSTFYPSGINSTLPSGIYFYQLTAGEFVETKKMMFLK
jgi:hypothetical protein